MASPFHNRLIGTVILVSIGVIFLPDLLTGKHHKPQVPVDSMPLNPQEIAAKAPVSAAQPSANTVSGANTSLAQGTQVAQAGSSSTATGGVVVSGNSQPAAQPSSANQGVALQQTSGEWTSEEVATPVTVQAPAHPNSAATLAAATAAAAAKAHQTKPVQPTKPQPVKTQPSKPVTTVEEKAGAARGYDSAVVDATGAQPTTQPSAQPAATTPRKPSRVQSGQIRSFAEVMADDHGSNGAKAASAKPAATAVNTVPATAATTAPKPLPTTPTTTSTAAVNKPAVPAATAGTAWVIQAGVFSSADNAKSLVAKLRAGGLPASLVPIHGGLYRVTVGPDVSRSNMESLVPRVSSIAGTSAKLISYAAH